MKQPPPIPTSLISGYLGAGKSTMINYLLAHNDGRRITVLVNDFGEIAIDSELIANQSGDTLALTNGCMCCSIGGALYDAIDKVLRSDPRPDHLIIETSGVADPAKIAQIALCEPEMEFAGCLTLVDAVNFGSLRQQKYIGDTVDRQVANAQVTGVSKSDLADQNQLAEISSVIGNLNSKAAQITISNGRIPFDFLLEIFANQKGGNSAVAEPPLTDHSHGSIYNSWSYQGSAHCSIDDLKTLSDPAIHGVYRLKGYLCATDGKCYFVQRAGTDFQFREVKSVENVTKLVAIGPASSFFSDTFEQAWRKIQKLPHIN